MILYSLEVEGGGPCLSTSSGSPITTGLPIANLASSSTVNRDKVSIMLGNYFETGRSICGSCREQGLRTEKKIMAEPETIFSNGYWSGTLGNMGQLLLGLPGDGYRISMFSFPGSAHYE